jgi:hypothetical protein
MIAERYASAYGMLNGGVQVAVRKLRYALEEENADSIETLCKFLDDLLVRAARVREGGEHTKPAVDISELRD